jgi:hypothetical protein
MAASVARHHYSGAASTTHRQTGNAAYNQGMAQCCGTVIRLDWGEESLHINHSAFTATQPTITTRQGTLSIDHC